MSHLIHDVLLVLTITYLTGVQHVPQIDGQTQQQAQFHQQQRQSSAQPQGFPDAGRHSAVTDALLPSDKGAPEGLR